MKRIWKKKSIEGYTEEYHSQKTKDGLYSIGIELNFRFPPFVYDRREFEYGQYSVYISDKDDNIIHEIRKFLHTSKDGLNLIREAKTWVQEQFYS
jgi:hypothetical protein